MYTKGEWKIFNSTDIFSDNIQICDCQVHKKVFDTDTYLDFEEMKANAQRIVQCVNSHDDLVAILKIVRDYRNIHHRLPLKDTELMDKIEQTINKADKK